MWEGTLEGISCVYVHVNGELVKVRVDVSLRQECVMLPWMCNIYNDVCMRDMKVRVGDLRQI